jgi:choline dehydrogenase
MPLNLQLIPELRALAPGLIIFDKDGTLLDFHRMWGTWITELGRRLQTTLGPAVASRLYEVMDFDLNTGYIAPKGHLAVTPMAELRNLTITVLREFNFDSTALEAALLSAWHSPDPVLLAYPLTNLTILFKTLQAEGLKIAINTSDDRTSTEATLASLGLAGLIDALVCADDGLPIKPAPETVLSICRSLDIAPSQTVVVGDNADDLKMGYAAATGLRIGVLSGVSLASDLARYADFLLPSVAYLLRESNNL